MANQNVNIAATVTLESRQANAALDATQKKIDKLKSTASAPSKALSKAKELTDEQETYRQARAGRGTGAEGRDFAKQAQGLGGLVHVYATFAANLFAVSAAFSALSKAADYTNMVEGLNQLGAASGKNLGTMAKRVSELTDGAVNLKEAMVATAQASAAGMSGEQLERMTVVAKKASQALGRDMGDSLSRVSRGITKLEPELLDEIGLFVRVDKAAEEYARRLGKTTTSLTDFERRQAFAIATLEQGEKKFGKINIESNPYNQLLASFQNLAYSGGELLNKVLAPIARILAESPVALGAAMTGMVAMLVNKAIPAVSEWKQGVLEAAEEAEAKAKRINESLVSFKVNKSLEGSFAAQEESDEYRAQAAKIATDNKLFGDKSKTMYQLASSTGDLGFAADQTGRKLSALTTAISKEETALKTLSSTDTQAIKISQAKVQQLKEQEAQYIKLAATIKLSQQAQETSNTLGTAAENAPDTLEEKMRQRIADKATRSAARTRISANVISDTENYGAAHAWKQISENIKEHNAQVTKAQQIGKLSGAYLQFSGALKIVGSSIMTLVSALSDWLMAIGLVVVGFQMLDGWLSSSAKELEAFKGASEGISTALDGMKNTVDLISTKDPFEKLGAESIQAIATATNELSSSFTKLLSSLENVDKYANNWDKFVDSVKDLFGAGLKDTAEAKFSATISSMLTNSIDSAAKKEFQSELSSILGTTDFSTSNIDKIFETMNSKKFLEVSKEINKVQDKFSKVISNSASRLTEYNTSVVNTEKQMQTLVASFNPSDNMAKFGIAQMEQAGKLAKALKDPVNALSLLSDTASDFSKLKLLPPDIAIELSNLSPKLTELREQLGGIDDQLRQAQNRTAQAKEAVGSAKGWDVLAARQKVQDSEALEGALNKARQKTLEESNKIAEEAKKYSTQIYAVGAKHLAESFKLAAEQASLTYKKTVLQGIEGPGATKATSDIQVQELEIQKKIIQSQANLILSQEKLRLTIEENTISKDLENDKLDFQSRANLLQRRNNNTEAQDILKGDNPGNNIKKLSMEKVSDYGLGAARNALEGISSQISKIGLDQKGVRFSESIKLEEDKLKIKLEGFKAEQEANKIQISTYDRLASMPGIYSDTLIKNKQSLEAKNDQLNIDIASAELLKIQNQNAIRRNEIEVQFGKSSETTSKLKEDMNRAEETKTREIDRLKQTNILNESNRLDALAKKREEAYKMEIELENRKESAKLNIRKAVNDSNKQISGLLEETGLISKSKKIELDLELDLASATDDYTKSLREKTQAHKLELGPINQAIEANEASIRNTKLSTEQRQAAGVTLVEQRKHLLNVTEAQKLEVQEVEASNILKRESIKIQAEYQAALVKTEDFLRQSEKTGLYGEKYFDALAQDFNNKITTMLQSAKSAGATLTEGLISAIDSTTDKFFELMQTGALTTKAVVDTLRQGLSDALRDTASQLMKNSWKQFTKGIIGESEAEKSVRENTTALQDLTLAIRGIAPTKSEYNTGVGAASTEGLDDWTKNTTGGLEEAGSTQKSAALLQAENTEGFATSLSKFMTGQTSLFDFTTGTLQRIFSYLVTSLGVLFSSSGGGSSGGLFSGILGTLVKGAVGAFTGGAPVDGFGLDMIGATNVAPNILDGVTWAAKGGVFDSPSLSRYSNTVVTSPTTFAFAKGAGIMGEAGPEAIVPLKRDAQGNLGIRGGSSGDVNISIVINSESGETKSSSSGSAAPNFDQFAKNMSQMIQAEMVKQKRPGGLLYA